MRTSLLVILLLLTPLVTEARQSLDLMVDGVGLSIGDSEEVTGLRLNFRDRNMRMVRGVNATIWTAHEPMQGTVNGVALGLLATSAEYINGYGWGFLGVGAEKDLKGVAFGGLAVGAGRDLTGVMSGGIGVGAGGDVRGLVTAGVGAGAGGELSGLVLAGIGAGAGGNVAGLVLAGIGVGAGGDFDGLGIAGIGAGAGGDVLGVLVSGIGTGAGGDITGITLSGLAAGSGGTMTGLHVAGFAIGAESANGLIVAPGYFRIEEGFQKGLAASAVSIVRGEQRGLTIGLYNYARNLRGVQIGLINHAANKKRFKVLPLVNF